MEAILDTSVIIAISKNDRIVIEKLEKFRGWKFYITTITNFELKVGFLSEKEKVIIEALPKLFFDEKASDIASELFKNLKLKGKIPKLKDLFIASIALANNKPVITIDQDFLIFTELGLKVFLLEYEK
ncbi:MAG: type II toxin-antitoxin system VapC family toxin [Thermoplasmata archaeon]|nr:MAG: type II toxin-antitoxin system VapC family toxin [Thermoplasmata archaeon]